MMTFEQISISGHVIEQDVPSNVSINKNLALTFSTELQNGIKFEDVIVLPANNVDANKNYNITDNTTAYYVEVSNDGNVAVDLCIRANVGLTSGGGDMIGLDNETFAYSFDNNLTLPNVGSEISLTTAYSDAGQDIPLGSRNYLRFWLDVPAGQASGQYNNSIFFKGVPFDIGC